VGESTAEQIKIQIGSAFPLEEELEMEVKEGIWWLVYQRLFAYLY
jgi:actin-like ATPase involved in cell morphogenesis